jgi:hypothetical protein
MDYPNKLLETISKTLSEDTIPLVLRYRSTNGSSLETAEQSNKIARSSMDDVTVH